MPDAESNLAGMYLGNRRYHVERKIGQGGMGAVWLATDENLGEPVALKLLPDAIQFDPAALDDMRRETARSRRLSHPNIVRIHDLHEFPDERPFISMEYIDGATLSRFKTDQQCRCLPWDFVRTLLGQLCAALHYAHGENLIHRDLKPGNLMLDHRHRLKLADFGISAVVSDSMSRVSLQGNTSGTPAYMSPQQMDGRTPRVTDDIYALGATLYDLLTGKPPFFRGDIIHQVRNLEPPTIEERLDEFGLKNPIPPDVSAMIMACLAKEPEKRPQTAAAVAEWIGLGLSQEPNQSALASQVFDSSPPADSPSSRELTVMTGDESTEPASANTSPETESEPATNQAQLADNVALPYDPPTVARPRRRWPRLALIAIVAITLAGLAFAFVKKDKSPRNQPTAAASTSADNEKPFAGPWQTKEALNIESGRVPGMFRLHPVDKLRNCTVVTLERSNDNAPIQRTVEAWRPENQVWSIDDGIIRARLKSDEPGQFKSYLVFNGLDLQNFILNFAYRETRSADTSGNCGIFYRCRNLNGWSMDGLAMILGNASGKLHGIPRESYREEQREMTQTGLKRPLREFLSQAARMRLNRDGGHLGTLRVADGDFVHIIDQRRGHHFEIIDDPAPPESGTIALEVWIDGPGETTVEFEGLAYRTGLPPRGMLF